MPTKHCLRPSESGGNPASQSSSPPRAEHRRTEGFLKHESRGKASRMQLARLRECHFSPSAVFAREQRLLESCTIHHFSRVFGSGRAIPARTCFQSTSWAAAGPTKGFHLGGSREPTSIGDMHTSKPCNIQFSSASPMENRTSDFSFPRPALSTHEHLHSRPLPNLTLGTGGWILTECL